MIVAKYPPIHQPFAEQLEFFRKKLNLPTEAWDDIERMAHDRAFIVAGAQGADLLYDLRAAVDQSIELGTGLGQIRKDFRNIVAKHGWTGWTGEGTKGGEAWRTKVIYQTNMATSYAAGRWKQLTDPALLKVMPYWQYHHMDGLMHPRPLHESWDGLVLHWTHPFWRTHFPINGWGCHCWVTAATKEKYMLAIANGKGHPPKGWDTIDPKTGAPVGIDKGFDYAPGANANRPLKDFIDQKLIKLDAPVGAAMMVELEPVLALERQLAWAEQLDRWIADGQHRGDHAILGALQPSTLKWLHTNGKPDPASAEIALFDNLVLGAKAQRHADQQNALTLAEWREIPALLRKGDIYFDKHSGHLVFVGDGIGQSKMAVEFEPLKTRKHGGLNRIVTAFRVSDVDVAGMVKGELWLPVR